MVNVSPILALAALSLAQLPMNDQAMPVAGDASSSTTLSGVIEAYIVDDFDLHTSKTYYSIRGDDGTSRPIKFHDRPRLRPGTRISVSGQAVGEDFIVQTSRDMSTLSSIVSGPDLVDNPIVGEQTTIVLLFNFQDNTSEIKTVAEVEDLVFNTANPDSANSRLLEQSLSKAWLAGDVLDWVTLPINAADCGTYILPSTANFQNAATFVSGMVNLNLYKRIIVLTSSSSGCPYGAVGSFGDIKIATPTGSIDVSVALAQLPDILNINTPSTIMHELGHNFELGHHDDLECGDLAVGDYADGCDTIDRGDKYDLMAGGVKGHFNASAKQRLGWFDPQNIAELGTGTYEITLFPLELPSNQVQIIRIPVNYNLEFGVEVAYYTIEFRQAIGRDSIYAELDDPTVGVFIHLEEKNYLTGTMLLDMSPNVTTGVLSQFEDSGQDAFLRLGQTFSDTKHDITVTFSGVATGAAIVTVVINRICGDGVCDLGEDSCTCSTDCGLPSLADCTQNGIPDECEPDCNGNGIADSCDIANSTSEDCPGGVGNGIPDVCDPQVDCNGNGVIDSCDISGGASSDLNANDVPDDCELHDMVYVDILNCLGLGSGTMQDPFCNIQDAIDAQNPILLDNEVVEIIVADGIYTGDRNKNLDFAGRLLTVRSANGPTNCIIDMEGDGRGFYFHSGETAGARIEGLTIRNGYFGTDSDSIGSGIYCFESSPTIIDCTITGNTAEAKGGGIAMEQRSHPIIRNCRIMDNLVSGTLQTSGEMTKYGGGIYCGGSNPMISDCVISNNIVTVGMGPSSGCHGGGISLWDTSSPTITGCIVSDNLAISNGGGIYCTLNSNPMIRDCTITNNRTTTFSFTSTGGGGIYALRAGPTIDRCTITGNTTIDTGGGIFISRPRGDIINIRNCLIASNVGSSKGGGIYLSTPFAADAMANIENCTIIDNFSQFGDGILYQGQIGATKLDVTNCILRDNSDIDESAQIAIFNGNPAINYNNIQGLTGALGGVGNIDSDPLYVSSVDFRLTQCSPCVNAGDNSAVTTGADLDLNTRIMDDVVDMGAYELTVAISGMCQPGTFSETGDYSCVDPCDICPVGTFQSSIGASECLPCEPGTFAATTRTAVCDPCPLGMYQSNEGAIDCLRCEPGTFAATTGSALCSPCPEETFQLLSGALACDACDCNDGNSCTTNGCAAVTGKCQNEAIINCSVPAASTWSLIYLTLLLLIAGTILTSREMRRVP